MQSSDLAPRTVPQDPFDAYERPDLYEGLRSKRIFAFLIDALAVTILTFGAGILVFILGIFTLGLAWFMYAILPATVALIYTAMTLGGPSAATPGMKAMGLEMRLWHGAKPYALLAAVHVLFFWFSFTLFTPLVLLVSLFSGKKRLLHDLVLGVVVMNSDALRR